MSKKDRDILFEEIKSKVESFEPAFNQEHWEAMEKKLQQQTNPNFFVDLPIKNPFLYVSIGLLLFSGIFFLQRINKDEVLEVQSKNVEDQRFSQKAEKKPYDLFEKRIKSAIDKSSTEQTLTESGSHEPGIANYSTGRYKTTNINRISHFKGQYVEPLSPTYISEQKIIHDIKNDVIHEDSTTYKVMKRNGKKWKNAVVVVDWTSSMFEYGTQVIAWIRGQKGRENIKGFVFFNDCDSSGTPLVESDRPGYMAVVKSNDTEEVLATMLEAVRVGYANEDYSENDIEALIFAQEQFPDIDEIILIADNKSSVRDMKLLKELKKPVRTIICGNTFDIEVAIQPDYIRIAGKSRGSLHTIENDIMNIRRIRNGSVIRIANSLYKYDFDRRNYVPLAKR